MSEELVSEELVSSCSEARAHFAPQRSSVELDFRQMRRWLPTSKILHHPQPS